MGAVGGSEKFLGRSISGPWHAEGFPIRTIVSESLRYWLLHAQHMALNCFHETVRVVCGDEGHEKEM